MILYYLGDLNVLNYYCLSYRPEIPEDSEEMMRSLGVKECPGVDCNAQVWEWELKEHLMWVFSLMVKYFSRVLSLRSHHPRAAKTKWTATLIQWEKSCISFSILIQPSVMFLWICWNLVIYPDIYSAIVFYLLLQVCQHLHHINILVIFFSLH